MNLNFDEVICDEVPHKCKGMIYRYRESIGTTAKGGVVRKQEIYPLKRMSCGDDCDSCRAIRDCLMEDGIYELAKDVKSGDMVKLDTVEDSRDWETNICDGWHVVATKVQMEH